MFCPRCGHANDEGNRFCVSCGAELADTPVDQEKEDSAEPVEPAGAADPKVAAGKPNFLERVVGTSKRERYITAATVLALLIAVIAFILLDTPDDDSYSDPFLKASDERCLLAKQQIEDVTTAAGNAGGRNAQQAYADGLLRVVVQWRSDQRTFTPSSDQQDAQSDYLAALLTLSNALADLAEAARAGTDTQGLGEAAAEADAAAADLETQIDELGLEQCGALAFQPGPGSG